MAFPVSKIEEERRLRFMSQWDLARVTNIIQSRLSLIERGEVKPKSDEIKKISEALKMSFKEVESLFGEEKENAKEK